MYLKNKKILSGLLSVLLLGAFYNAKAQGTLDSISPDGSVTFTTSAQYPWTVSRSNNKWVAKAGNTRVNSSTSSLYATVVVPQGSVDGTLTFTYRVSSQASYDILYIYVDNVPIDGFSSGKSGTVPETEVDVPLSVGTHTVEWVYQKNASTHTGEDAAFVSDVRLSVGYCTRPGNITINYAADSSASLSWHGGAATNIEYGVSGFERGNGMADYVTDTFYTLINLQPNTYYTVYLQTVCPNGDTSVWVRTTFRTACSAITSLPYTQDFESWTASSSVSSTIDPCWSRSSDYYPTSYSYPYVTTGYSHSGNKSVYFYGSSNTYYSMLVMPMFADTINTLQVSFWMYTSSSSYQLQVGVISNPDDISTFTPISVVNCSSANTWTLKEVPLSAYAGRGRYIAFKTPSTSYSYCYIDDVTVEKIPSCRRPTNLTVRNVSTTSATVSWTAGNTNSYLVEYGYPGFPIGSGTRIQCNSTSQTLTNLNPATSYEVYVTSNCANGETNRSVPLVFHTSCGRIKAVPYVETFENIGTGAVSSKLPCWKAGSNYSTSYPSVNSQSGTNALYMYVYRSSSSTIQDMYAYIATPPIDTNLLPLRTLQVSFKMLRPTTSYMHELAFGVMTDSADITTFDTIDLIRSTTSGIWTTYTYNMSNYRGEGRFFAFKTSVYHGQYYTYPYIDDIVIENITTCTKPTDLQIISTYDPDDVQFSWKSWPAQASSWDISYGPTGFSPYIEGIKITGVTDTVYSLSGLSADTTYDIYVRSQCNNDSSMWSESPITVTPGTIVLPRQGTQTYYLCDAMIYDNGGEHGNYTDNNSGSAILYTMSSDSLMSINGTYSTESSYDYITVYDGAGTSGTQLARVSGAGTLSCTSTIGPLTIVFSSDVGVNMSGFAFRAQCVAPPNCRRPIPNVLSVESRQATIDVISSPANSWIMEFATSSFNPGQGRGITVSRASSNFTLTGLQPRTTYYAYIRTDCGNGDTSQWSYRFSFTTPCDPETVLPFNEDFSSLAVNSRRSCWTHSGSYPQTRLWHNSTNNKAYYFYARAGETDHMAIQKFADIPISDLRLKFSLFGTDTNTVFTIGVMTNPSDYSTFVPVTSFHVMDEYDWHNYEIPLSSSSSNAGYIAFSATNPNAETVLYLDNLMVDTHAVCLPPVLDTIIKAQTGATLIWNSQGASRWVLEYGHKGFVRGTTTAYILSVPTTNLAGLQPNSEYDVYLRTICSDGDTSEWILNPIRFSTACEQRALPYSENFDRYYGSPYSKYTRAMPTCWSIVSASAPLSQYRPQLYRDSVYAVTGGYSLMLSAPATVATPAIDASLDTVTAEFFMRVDNLNTGLIVGVVENPDADSTFVAIDTVFNTATDVYQLHDVVFKNYGGSAKNIAFRNYSLQNTDTMRVFLDSLVIRPSDSCVRPNNVTVSDITAHTVRVVWNERGTATSWILEYDTVGYTPGTGTQIAVNTNPYLLTGLDSNRAYAINIRSICEDTSKWTTLPAEFLLPRCDESCFYTLYMNSVTSGWFGASVEVRYDEYSSVNYTISNRSDVATIVACPDEIVAFSWIPGQFDNYCRFVLTRGDDTLYASNGTPQQGLFYTTTCGSDTACHDATNLSTTFIDYRTVEANWYGTGNFEIACKRFGSSVYMFKDTVNTNTYVNTYRIDSLNPDTNYVWMVRKLCYTDSLSSWQICRFKIADNMCVVPVDLTLNRTSNNSASIQWESFANNISWGVRCFAPSSNFDTVIYANNKYLTINGLLSGVTYYVSVKGLCRDSLTSIWSDTIAFTTDVCDTVSGVSVSNIGNNSATVTWTSGDSQLRWEVDYGTRGFPVGYGTTRQTTSTSYNITGLTSGTTYDVYVRAICGTDYYSVWSMKVTFTTTGTSSIALAESDVAELRIIPNPAAKTTTIYIDGIEGKTVLCITDVSGKAVLRENVASDGSLEKTVDVSQFAKGTYFVHVANEKTNIVQKLIVQ